MRMEQFILLFMCEQRRRLWTRDRSAGACLSLSEAPIREGSSGGAWEDGLNPHFKPLLSRGRGC